MVRRGSSSISLPTKYCRRSSTLIKCLQKISIPESGCRGLLHIAKCYCTLWSKLNSMIWCPPPGCVWADLTAPETWGPISGPTEGPQTERAGPPAVRSDRMLGNRHLPCDEIRRTMRGKHEMLMVPPRPILRARGPRRRQNVMRTDSRPPRGTERHLRPATGAPRQIKRTCHSK